LIYQTINPPLWHSFLLFFLFIGWPINLTSQTQLWQGFLWFFWLFGCPIDRSINPPLQCSFLLVFFVYWLADQSNQPNAALARFLLVFLAFRLSNQSINQSAPPVQLPFGFFCLLAGRSIEPAKRSIGKVPFFWLFGCPIDQMIDLPLRCSFLLFFCLLAG